MSLHSSGFSRVSGLMIPHCLSLTLAVSPTASVLFSLCVCRISGSPAVPSSPSGTLAPSLVRLVSVLNSPVSLYFWICFSNSESLSLCVWSLSSSHTSVSLRPCPSLSQSSPALCIPSLCLCLCLPGSAYLCLSFWLCFSDSLTRPTLSLILPPLLLALNQPCHHVSKAVHVPVAESPIFHLWWQL